MQKSVFFWLWVILSLSITSNSYAQLSVVEVNPVPFSTNATIDNVITIEVSESIDEFFGFDPSFLSVIGSRSGRITPSSVVIANNVIIFTPAPNDPYIPGEIIRVTLSPRVISLEGSRLEVPYTFQFQVRTDVNTPIFQRKDLNWTIPVNTTRTSTLNFFDHDGDNNLDVYGTFGDNQVVIFFNDGLEAFRRSVPGLNVPTPRDIFGDDVDGDGLADIIVGINGRSNIASYLSSNNFAQTNINASRNDILGLSSIFSTDINGDGAGDVLWTASGSVNGIGAYINDGAGNFTREVIDLSVVNPSRILSGDLNNDGLLDLIVASQGATTLGWYPGDSTVGVFNSREMIDNTTNITLRETADLDGDGWLDVITSSPGQIIWFRNNGDSTFQSNPIPISGRLTPAVLSGDFNGDGHIDLAVYTGTLLSLYINDGAATPSFIEQEIESIQGFVGFAVADVDADGNLDIFAPSRITNTILFYKNNPLRLIGSSDTIRVLEDASPTPRIALDNFFQGGATPPNFTIIGTNPSTILNPGVDINTRELTLALLEDQNGIVEIQVQASSLPEQVEKTFIVDVSPVNDLPEVINPIPDTSVTEGVTQLKIPLADVFEDGDGDPIIFDFVSTDRLDILTPSLNGDTLILTFQSEFGIDIAEVTIRATANGDPISDAFFVRTFPVDDPPQIVNPIPDAIVQEDFGSITIDLKPVFTDPEGDPITFEITRDPAGIVLFNLDQENAILTINSATDKNGVVTFCVTAFSGPARLNTKDTFIVQVEAIEDGPRVENPIPDIFLQEDLGNTPPLSLSGALNISEVFTDVDSPIESILLADPVNNNESLLSIVLDNDSLRFTLRAEQNGQAEVIICASSPGGFACDTFMVFVNEVDDRPTVVNPIGIISRQEDEIVPNIPLNGTFNDIDNDNALIQKSVVSNSNPSVATATVINNALEITLTPDQSGETSIVLRGTSNGLFVDDIIQVIVTPLDDPLTFNRLLRNIEVEEDVRSIPPISLEDVFVDIDSEIEYSIVSNSNINLVETFIDTSSNEINLVFPGRDIGTSTIVVQGRSLTDGSALTDAFTTNIRLKAPDNLLASPVSQNEIELTWDYDTLLLGETIEIFRAIDEDQDGVGDFENAVMIEANPRARIASDLGLDANVTYYYRIRTRRGLDSSRFSNISSATTSNIPGRPTELVAAFIAPNNAQLTWRDQANNETGYQIERSSLLTREFTLIATLPPNAQSFVDPSLQENLTYSYRVRATSELGNSRYSNVDTVKISRNPQIGVPNAPRDLEATSISEAQIDLSWTYSLDTTTIFIVERTTVNNFINVTSENIDTVAIVQNDNLSPNKTASDLDSPERPLIAGRIYYYRVRAISSGGDSRESNIAFAAAICNLGEVLVVIRNDGGGDKPICTNKSASMTVIPVIFGASYKWRRNGVDIPGATFANYLASETGRYDCEVTVGQQRACTGLTLNDLVIAFDGDPLELEITFDGEAFRASIRDAQSYQWFRNFEPIDGATDNFLIPDENGVYFVIATFFVDGPEACSATSNQLTFPELVTSLEDSDISQYMEVYPNPSEGETKVVVSLDRFGTYNLSLVDIHGKRYPLERGTKETTSMQRVLDLKRFPKGIYFLEMNIGAARGYQKIVLY